jgi:hypothetical protein
VHLGLLFDVFEDAHVNAVDGDGEVPTVRFRRQGKIERVQNELKGDSAAKNFVIRFPGRIFGLRDEFEAGVAG